LTLRKIIRIDEEKCDGCGLCVPACAEGALQIIDGKAKLVSDVYCDGLGACLGDCPQGALTVEEREADEFDEKAVEEHLSKMTMGREKEAAQMHHDGGKLPCGCPGSIARSLERDALPGVDDEAGELASRLVNWPVQIHLMPVQVPYLQGSKLLISADCAPFAFADFHRRFMDGRVVLIGCPKLDDAQAYVKKLAEMFRRNDIREIEVAHMEVPCCFGLVQMVQLAVQESGVDIPVRYVKIGINGEIREEVSPEYEEVSP
jgi:NAD-dependent dihydropyrimidine dehydrogenase PreA subunit